MPKDVKVNVTVKGRGLQKFVIDPNVFALFLQGQLIKVTSSPLPLDARIIGAGYDHSRHAFILVVESSQFEKVPLGEIIPVMDSVEFHPVALTQGQSEDKIGEGK